MEPGETSPPPYGLYPAGSDMTQSPQPLSPSSAYSHNTPSPYSVASTVGTNICGNQQLLSPSQQYNDRRPDLHPNISHQMDISGYSGFGQQTQQYQQYHHNNFAAAGVPDWEAKFNRASGAASHSLSNVNNTSAFTMLNLLAPANSVGAPENGNGTSWNFHPQHHQQQQQQTYTNQHQPANEVVTTNNNAAVADAACPNSGNNANSSEHGISTLLTFDSEQLVRMNSEDQQMLRLNTEDLQISNLSIST